MAQVPATGGILLATSAGQSYKNTAKDDVLVYTGNSTQNMLMGPCNAAGNSMVLLTNSNMQVNGDTTVTGVSTMTELHIGQASPLEISPLGDFVFSNPTTFASTTTFAGYNNFAGPCNVFFGPVMLCSNVTIGGTSNNGYPLSVQSTGLNNTSIYAAGDIAALSDARHKTNLAVIPNALSKVNAISGYTFSWIERPNAGRSAGVIAQEVEAVLPEVISADDSGKLCVSYGNLSALLIQAIKELSGQMLVLSVTTTSADEEYQVALPEQTWSAAFISGGPLQYSRTSASISGGSVVGRIEVPGTYQIVVIQQQCP